MTKKVKPVLEEVSEIDQCILVLQTLVKKALLDSERESVIAKHFNPQYVEKLQANGDGHDGILLFNYVLPHKYSAKEYQYNADHLIKAIDYLSQLKQAKEI